MITLTSYHFEDTIKMNIPTICVAIIMIKFLVQRILVIIEGGSVTVRERDVPYPYNQSILIKYESDVVILS
jgi:hypothetical protein